MALSTTTTAPTGWAANAAHSNFLRAQDIANTPYQAYPGPLQAGWNVGQQGAYNSLVNGLGVGQQPMAQAQQFATRAGTYQPRQVTGGGYTPHLQGWAGTQAANAGGAQGFGVTNTGFADAGAAQQMAAAQMGRGEARDVQAGQFPGANLSQYMNPYTDAVVNTTLGQLGRQNDIIQQRTNAQAAKAGAFGGGRQAVANSENNRAFLDTAAQTTSNLYNQSFAQAQAAIAADQNRAMQAGQLNQAADLTVGQANLANRQQGALQNMLQGNQMTQFNASNAQRGIEATAASHNQAAQEYARQQNAMAQYNAGLAQTANSQTAAAQNAAMAGHAQAYNQAGQFGAEQALRAQLANQQAGLTASQTQLQAANYLNGMGLDQQQQLLRGAGAAFDMGQARTAFDQTGLDNAYNQWAARQNYPMTQLGVLQQGLNGYSSGTATTTPGASKNTAANVLSGALGGAQLGYGLSGGLTGWGALGGAAGGLLGLFG